MLSHTMYYTMAKTASVSVECEEESHGAVHPQSACAAQTLGATAQGRVLFTLNTHGFPGLAQQYPRHGGLVLAAQQRWTLSALITALDQLLTATDTTDWPGQVRWLKQWRLP